MYYFKGNHNRWCRICSLLNPLVFQYCPGAEFRGEIGRDGTPANHTSPPTACKAFSYANELYRALFGPIWRPSNGTCEAPDRCMFLCSGLFVSEVIRRHVIVGCFVKPKTHIVPSPLDTYRHTHQPPNPQTHPRVNAAPHC